MKWVSALQTFIHIYRLKWIPVRKWGIPKDDEDIKKLEETIFLYAKQNLAVVNVYIKVFHHLYYLIAKCNIMKIDCLKEKNINWQCQSGKCPIGTKSVKQKRLASLMNDLDNI